MTLNSHKIPTQSGRNETPTTDFTDPNHPNGSFFTLAYNNLIDELINLFNGITTTARNAISVTGNGSYDSNTGEITINNATQSVDNIQKTGANGLVDTYTVWGDSGQTQNLGTFDVTNGASVVSSVATDNQDGTHTVEFFNDLANTQKVGEVILSDGVQGIQGIKGDQGDQGVQGVKGDPAPVIVLTQAAYDALPSPDTGTFYVTSG